MKIIVNDIPPSNNQYMGNSHNFNIYRREKEKWHWLIKAAVKEKPKETIEKAMVHITYFFPDKRRRDPDNYAGKMILDPLVRIGVLKDDSFKNIELVLSGDYDKQNPRTEIEVKKIEDVRKSKTKAIKEFAERLTNKIFSCDVIGDRDNIGYIANDVHNIIGDLVKEMTERIGAEE